MDRITKQLVSDFLDSQEIASSSADRDFELFCNFSIISKEYNKTFDVEGVTVGAGNDTGIDGIGIIVNGHLVEDTDEIDDLIERNGYLEVVYIFVQAKTSSFFDSKEMHNFCFGVKDFFAESPRLKRNEDIAKFAEISEKILNNAADFKDNPVCKLYYVTTGKWSNDPNHVAIVNATKADLDSYNLFSDIEFVALGATDIGKIYRQTKNPNVAEFVFGEKVTLPDIPGVSEAYYGILPFSEFKKILIDENDKIRSVFDDNVRDFQGADNPVNKKIADTLGGNTPEQFCVLNNGVTVVANSLKTAGNKFIISDFQIVNGCQTSNVLFNYRKNARIDTLHIPFRLIVTDNDDVKGQITLATNSQTEIRTEQLAALSDFQKNLEHYYASIEGDGRLYYERRAKQYSSDTSVIKNRIITVANQIKSFSAMFLQNPHMVTSFFGSIAKKLGTAGSNIFREDHSYAPYYLSGLAFYKLDYLFRTGAIDSRYRKVKFHLLMLFRMIAEEEEVPPLNNSKKMERYCETIFRKLSDSRQCYEIFSAATGIVDKSRLSLADKTHVKQASMSENLIDTYMQEREARAAGLDTVSPVS